MNIVTCDTYPELPYPASYNLPYEGDPLDGGVVSTFMNEGVPGDIGKPAVHELEVCSPLLELEPGEEFCHISRSYQIRGQESAIDHICRTFFNVELSDLQRFAARSQL